MQLPDLIVLGAYLLLLFAVVWRFRHTTAHPKEFFLGGYSFGALPVGLSVMVTTFSAVNMLAFPGEVSRYGLYVIASIPVFFLAAYPVTRWWMPKLLKERPVSVYAMLETRCDTRVRCLAGALFLVWRLFWMAVALYASSRMMSMLTGIAFLPLLFLCGGAAALYCCIGGMRAVVWTDVLQFCVLIGTILLGVIFVWHGKNFSGELLASGKLAPFYPLDRHYFAFDPFYRISLWSALLGTFVTFLTRFGADQMVMQRYLAASSLKSARRGLWLNGIASTLALTLLLLFGLAMSVFARKHDLPDALPPVKVLAIVLKSFPAGATGLLSAALLAATMSSIDSGLNSATASLMSDWLWKQHVSPRVWTIVLALLVMAGAAFLLPELNRNNSLFVILNKSVNTIGTPLLAMMLCALFLPRIGAGAVFYGTIAGIAATIACTVCVRNLALHGYAVVSLAATMGAIMLFQLFGKRDTKRP